MAHDLSTHDGVLGLGRRVVELLAEEHNAEEIAEDTGASSAEIMWAVGVYVGLVFVRPAADTPT